ncbi:hypothetical protein EDB83DRAFT_2312883 [Lactarius deliciosus]|nr:hypothetical protein EDB83DRAFT_2312883 [Lactarius deliciosus]
MPFPRRLERVMARESLAETIPQASSPSVPASATTIATPPAPGGSGQAKSRAPPVRFQEDCLQWGHFFSARSLCFSLLLPEATHALWPQSRNLQTGSSALRLGPSFAIRVAVPNAQKDLLTVAEGTRTLIFSDKYGCIVLGPGADGIPAVWRAKALSDLTLQLLGNASGAPRPIATEATLPLGSRDEAYSLVVPADGSAAVPSANSTLGLFRGFMMFARLWYTASGTVYTRSRVHARHGGELLLLYDLMHPVMKEVYVMDFVRFHVIPASHVGSASTGAGDLLL